LNSYSVNTEKKNGLQQVPYMRANVADLATRKLTVKHKVRVRFTLRLLISTRT